MTEVGRQVLPIADQRAMGATTFQATDPETSYPHRPSGPIDITDTASEADHVLANHDRFHHAAMAEQ